MNQELLDKIEEIKQLVIDTEGELDYDNENLVRILAICDNILTKHKLDEAERRLNELRA